MSSSSWIATYLDEEMLARKGVLIADRLTPDDSLPRKPGTEVAEELGGRFLLRYMARDQVGRFGSGSNLKHYVTPTPYSPEETVACLSLPQPITPRTHIALLDPINIEHISGPRWVRLGKGIEYVLIDGFSADALVQPWELEVR